MATHDVSLNVTKPIPIGNVDIEIPVRRNGRAFGKVKISKGAIDWMPANKSKTAYYLDWGDFATSMGVAVKTSGSVARTRRPLHRASVLGHERRRKAWTTSWCDEHGGGTPPRDGGPPMTSNQMRVGACMHAGIVSCAADAPLAEVARIMGNHRVHVVVVAVADLGHGRPYGVWRLVSHMDVVAAIATGQAVLAREVAATEATRISAGDPLERAAELMSEHAVSHLLVVDPSGDYPVGIISTLDVISAFGGSQHWGTR